MGLILDSSVLITAERQGQNARQTLAAISGKAGNTDVAISVVTLIELTHGAARADTVQRKEKRQQFIQELLTALPIHPVTVSLALRVGQIDGENQAKGVRLPLSDLLIGVTALELGYSVATGNLRHFQTPYRYRGDGEQSRKLGQVRCFGAGEIRPEFEIPLGDLPW